MWDIWYKLRHHINVMAMKLFTQWFSFGPNLWKHLNSVNGETSPMWKSDTTVSKSRQACVCVCAGNNWKFPSYFPFSFTTTQPQNEPNFTFFANVQCGNLCYPGDAVWLFLFVAMCVISFYVRLGGLSSFNISCVRSAVWHITELFS